MTISPSYSDIPELAPLLDTSNFTIQAMSFGTAPQSYASGTSSARKINPNTRLGLVKLVTDKVNTNEYSALGLTLEETPPAQNPIDTYTPTAPDPQLEVLELSTNLPIDPNPNAPESPYFDVSTYVSGTGQHQNYHPSSTKFSIFPPSGGPSTNDYFIAAAFLGTYPPGASEAGTVGPMLLTFSSLGSASPSQELSLTAGSYPNEASSIDADGFISVVSGTNSQNGVTVSSNASFASNGIVEYALTLSKDDVAALNFYGGVYHMGLWALDLKESLTAGNSPPFAFSALDNPRKYKLFCRKGLSKDLTYIDDITQYQDMTIKWRLRFL